MMVPLPTPLGPQMTIGRGSWCCCRGLVELWSLLLALLLALLSSSASDKVCRYSLDAEAEEADRSSVAAAAAAA